MPANGLLNRDSVFDQLIAEIFHLRNAAFQIFEIGTVFEAYRKSFHVAASHTTISDKAFEHDVEHTYFLPEFFAVHGNESTNIHDGVFL
ncbi:hypothetical protein DSECCO2_586490 [anaerobic digester metagenome]